MVAKFAAIVRGLEARFRAEQLEPGLKTCGVGFECDPSVTIAYPDRTEVGCWVYIEPEEKLHACGGGAIRSHDSRQSNDLECGAATVRVITPHS